MYLDEKQIKTFEKPLIWDPNCNEKHFKIIKNLSYFLYFNHLYIILKLGFINEVDRSFEGFLKELKKGLQEFQKCCDHIFTNIQNSKKEEKRNII